MKHFITAVILLAAVLALPLLSTDAAYASEDNYSLVMPSSGNYLYMSSPRTLAVDGDTVAVYDFDNGTHRVYIAGASVESFVVSLDDPEEYVTQLAFLDDKLFVLTCFSKLFSYDISTNVLTQLSIGCTAAAIYPTDDALYIYGGYNTIYKCNPSDLSLTSYTDAKYKIIGTKQIVVSGDVAYCLKWNGELFSFDFTTLTVSVKYAETPINAISFIESDTDMLLAYSDDDAPKITMLNLDGSIVGSYLVSELTPETGAYLDIVSDGTTVAVLDAGAKSVLLLNDDLEIIDVFGCTSSREGMFETPSALMSATVNNGTDDVNATVTLDSGNKRVAVSSYDETGSITATKYMSYGFNAINCVGYYDGQVYLSDGRDVYYSGTDFHQPSVITTGFDVISFAVCDDGLYLLDGETNSVYRASHSHSSEFARFARVSDSTKIIKTSTCKGSPLYLLDDNGIYLSTMTGKLSAEINFDENSSPSDFAVDYVGNVFVAEGKTITKYERSLDTFTKGESITLANASSALNSVTALSVNSVTGFASAIDSERHVLVNITEAFGYVDMTDYTASVTLNMLEISANDVSFAKATNCNLYQYDNNYNLISDSVLSGDRLLTFKFDNNNDLVYVMTEKNFFGYVPTSAISPLTAVSSDTSLRALHDTVNVYTFPSTDSASVDAVGKDVTLIAVDNACDFMNGYRWLRVSYEKDNARRVGFVMRTRVSEYVVNPPPADPMYGKAQTSRIGAKINVYSMQDTDSAIITSLTDGDKVLLLADYDENARFTLVQIDDKVGYILTSELNMDNGLTNGQIIAIVLAALTLGITAVYFFIVKRNRKQNNRI